MRPLFKICIYLILYPSISFGQITISGIVVDQQTQLPIEYANIGIPDKGIGTVGDQEGNFSLYIPAGLSADPLYITHLGYETKTVTWQEYNDRIKIKIEMIPKVNDLMEFTFSGRDKIEPGYRPQDDKAKGYFIADGLGMEGGTVIWNRDTIELNSFHMNILELPYDSMRFRLNMYTLHNGQPQIKLNRNNINFILQKNNLGIFSLSLPENLVVTGNFICTLELIEVFGGVAKDAHFTFSAIPDKRGLIFKKGISMGKWGKIKGYSLCFWFDARK